MMNCTACGRVISKRDQESTIRERDQVYHLKCAPGDLIGDANEEWNAVATRGIGYFVQKYLVPPTEDKVGRPARDEVSLQLDYFRAFGANLRNEAKKRRPKRKKD